MAFCRFCGNQKPDNTVCPCQTVQATPNVMLEKAETPSFIPNPAPVQDFNAAPVAPMAPVAGTVNGIEKNPMVKKAAVAGVAILAVIITLIILFGGGYKKPIRNYFKAIENGSVSDLAKCYPKQMAKDVRKRFDDSDIEDRVKRLERKYGDGISYRVKFTGKEELDSDAVENLVKSYKNAYDRKIVISQAYYVDCSVRIKGSERKVDEDMTFVVAKVKGEGWKIMSYDEDDFLTGGNYSSYSDFDW